MSYYLTRGQMHLIAPGDTGKTICGQSLEYINKATFIKAICTCKKCLRQTKELTALPR